MPSLVVPTFLDVATLWAYGRIGRVLLGGVMVAESLGRDVATSPGSELRACLTADMRGY